jgi:predicted N-acetyltransferase YhbS
MSITLRRYAGPDDFGRVGEFLIENYEPGNRDGNWLQPAWEYMHSHPYLDESSLDRIGIWEDAGRIVAVAHYESRLGEAFFEIRPGYTHLKETMLEYAENHLHGEMDGRKFLNAFVNDFDPELEQVVNARGYEKVNRFARPVSLLEIPRPFPRIEVPDGFRLKSLADENNYEKIHRVLWRGFNHPGEPPEEGIADRIKMQSTPNFRQELTIVAEEPGRNFVAFSGTWYVAKNKMAYVEPVATDPDYRRMGLGKAAVLEGIRRCGELGATVAYVGSDLPFYMAIGFRKLFDCNCWRKQLDL